MNVWLIHRKKGLKTFMDVAILKAEWMEWKPQYMTTQGKIERIADTIEQFLEGLDISVRKISTNKIKKELELTEEVKQTFSATINLVSDRPNGWTLMGRSMVRIFTSEI